MSHETKPHDQPLLERQLELIEEAQRKIQPGTEVSLDELVQRTSELATVFKCETIPRHEKEIDEIRKNDIALQPRLKQLHEEDRRIVALLDDAVASAESLNEHSELTTEQISNIKEELTTIVTDIRKQRDAITKWLSESLLRDRGFASS